MASAQVAEVSPFVISRWRQVDPLFAANYALAERLIVQALEAAAIRFATQGLTRVREIRDARGEPIRTITETAPSERLLQFLLKAQAPERYGSLLPPDTAYDPAQAAATDQQLWQHRREALTRDRANRDRRVEERLQPPATPPALARPTPPTDFAPNDAPSADPNSPHRQPKKVHSSVNNCRV